MVERVSLFLRFIPQACHAHVHSRLRAAVKIVKVLGEGGFSFVYLAQDEHSGVRAQLVAG